MTYAVYYQWRGRPEAGWHLYQRWTCTGGVCWTERRTDCERTRQLAATVAAELRAVGIVAEVREERET